MLGSRDHEGTHRFGGTERFEVIRRIGAGGMGFVYEARDRDTDRRVALKTLRSMSADALLLFKNEFRAIADVRHPNLIGLGELFEQGGEWFFTMDLVDGVNFLAYVRAPTGRDVPTAQAPLGDDESTRRVAQDTGPEPARARREDTIEPRFAHVGPDIDRLRAALLELVTGLVALHDAAKVHCDVKPSNVLVTREGKVVLLDFGLVSETTAPHAGDRRAGTVAYMAPEQTLGGRVGPPADWYAVGVVLYQALTGFLPVRGTPGEILAKKRVAPPSPPSAFAAGVPHDLDRLCVELLRIDPARRPTGREVLQWLGAERAPSLPPSREVPFIGRGTELSLLRDAFLETTRGASVTVLVSGDSGVGKTAFTRHFAEEVASAGGALVLRSRCYERESVPYKAVDGLVDALSHHLSSLDADSVRALCPRHLEVVVGVFPVLRRMLTVVEDEEIVRRLFGGEPQTAEAPTEAARDPHLRRTQLFDAMRELFTLLAAPRPVVLSIDDLQWADADGLALLAHVMRPPAAPQLLLLGTVRTALATELRPSSAEPIASALRGDVRNVVLSTLPKEDARMLTVALLGDTHDPALIEAIVEEASGHPLFIDELVRRRSVPTHARNPIRLEDALWARIEKLDGDAKRLLEALVVAGGPISQEAAACAIGADFADIARHAAELRAQNLARTSGVRRSDSIEPYHDRLRAAVVLHLAPASKKRWHGALARAFEAVGATDPEALAVHLREAGEPLRAAEYAAKGATDALAALAFDRAARLFGTAIDLAPHSTAIATWHTKRGEAFANAGRGAEAAESFLAAARSTREAAEALDLRRRGAEELLHAGHVDRALAVFDDVLGAVGLWAPASPRQALLSLLVRRAELRLRGFAFDERGSAPTPETLTRIDTCWGVGAGLGLVDAIRGSYHQTRALLLALEAGEPRRIARGYAGEVCFSSADGGRSRRRTASLLGRATALAERIGDDYEIAWARGSGGIAATLEGRWAEGVRCCDEAVSLFEGRIGTTWEIGIMRWFAQWALAYRGRIRELVVRVRQGVRDADTRGDLYGSIRHRTGLQTWAWLAEDDIAGARNECREAMDRWSPTTFNVEHWWAMLAERQLDLYEDRGDAALQAVEAAWQRLSGSLLLRVQLTGIEAVHLRARATLASLSTRPHNVRDLLASVGRDAQRLRAARMPWSTPLADLLEGTCAARTREPRRAIGLVERAAAGFMNAGMDLYAAAAQHRAGELRGGDSGEQLRAQALALTTRESIRSPERFFAMLAPGFDRS